jgi:PAS domain S-box-containing protein
MLQSVFDASPLAVVILDQAGCVTSWNPAAERLFGWTAAEVLGQPYPAVPDVDQASYQAVLRAGMGGKRTVGTELTRRRKDGSLVTVQLWTAPVQDAEGKIVASLGLFFDMTERRRAETQLRDAEERLAHAARLKTMGEMVAGIAHEINQPLYAIGNYANACSNAVTLDMEMAVTRLPYWTRQINEQVTRAGEIIKRLRGFAQKSPGQRGAVPLNHLVRESLALLSGDLRRHVVRSQLELQESDPVVLADRVQIQQVLVNLVRNACEALSERPEAERLLIVRTRASAEWAITAVEDRGPGLPPDRAQRVFEPFFTTKPDGLGMGLAISHSIIEAHGGRFTAAPAEPQGAVFEFWLPLSN